LDIPVTLGQTIDNVLRIERFPSAVVGNERWCSIGFWLALKAS
jgi:hypothetical protein